MIHLNAYSKDNPSDPRDMLGARIAEGDYLVWPVGHGRANGVSVGRLLKINYMHDTPAYPHHGGRYVRRDTPHGAHHYTLRLQPLVTTGYYWTSRDGDLPKPVTIQIVGKVVRLSTEQVEAALAKMEAAACQSCGAQPGVRHRAACRWSGIHSDASR